MAEFEFQQRTASQLDRELAWKRDRLLDELRAVKADLSAVMLALFNEELQIDPHFSPLLRMDPAERALELLKRDDTGTRERFLEAKKALEEHDRAVAYAEHCAF